MHFKCNAKCKAIANHKGFLALSHGENIDNERLVFLGAHKVLFYPKKKSTKHP